MRVMPNGGALDEAVTEEFIDLLRGIPAFALEKAIEDYRRGFAGDPKWMPWPNEIAALARSIAAEHNRMERIAREEREEARNAARVMRGLATRTPEELERMGKLTEDAKAAILQAAAKEVEAEREKAARFEQLMQRHDEIFADELAEVRKRYFADAPQKRANG
jgi:hypothetical protein